MRVYYNGDITTTLDNIVLEQVTEGEFRVHGTIVSVSAFDAAAHMEPFQLQTEAYGKELLLDLWISEVEGPVGEQRFVGTATPSE